MAGVTTQPPGPQPPVAPAAWRPSPVEGVDPWRSTAYRRRHQPSNPAVGDGWFIHVYTTHFWMGIAWGRFFWKIMGLPSWLMTILDYIRWLSLNSLNHLAVLPSALMCQGGCLAWRWWCLYQPTSGVGHHHSILSCRLHLHHDQV